jgi:hypothetical protein
MDLGLHRLKNQSLYRNKFEKAEDVVKWMGAIQAQDYHQALWAIGVRMQSAAKQDIEQAIADKKILRTWPMRGTIHFVPALDVKWMVELSAERMLKKSRRIHESLELSEDVMLKCTKLFSDVLQGNKRYTRSQMIDLLEESGINTKNQRGYQILWYTSQIGLICQGPMQEKQQTFVLVDEWVPNAKKRSKNEALVELTKRYFASHGPATIQDFVWWSGLTSKDAKMGIELAKPEIYSQRTNEKEYWMSEKVPNQGEMDVKSINMLPGFDEYLLGYKDRSTALAAEHASKITPGNNGIFLPTLVVDGKVIGTWKRKQKKNSVEITVNLFEKDASVQEQQILEEARKYSKFIDLPLSSSEIDFSS